METATVAAVVTTVFPSTVAVGRVGAVEMATEAAAETTEVQAEAVATPEGAEVVLIASEDGMEEGV